MATITMYNDINVDNAFTPGFAAVGFNTAIVSTTADTTAAWTARALPSTANWNSVCYGNKQMVAVAGGPSTKAASGVGTATTTWTARTLPASLNWQSVIFGNGYFVAVANGATGTATSTDGITWASGGTMPSSAAWYNLAYGATTFVAVSTTNSTAAAYSTDNGTTWNAATLPAAKNWQSVCYGNGKFIAVSYGTADVAQSTNGITWTAAGSMPTARNWSSIVWGNPGNTANGIFVATSYGTAVGAISTDNGATWTEVALAPNVVINGDFTGGAGGWTLAADWTYSSNAVTHTGGGGTGTVTPTPALTIVAATLYEVTYTVSGVTAGNVTVNLGGTNGTARSTNGTFTEVITTGSTANLIFTPTSPFDGSIDAVSVRYAANWNCISYGEIAAQGVKVFTVTGYTTATTAVSFDGSNWFNKTISSAANWAAHCFAPIDWNSGDTLSVQNNATITVNTNQNKFWKTFTATYGKLSIQNASTSTPIIFNMGRSSAATANDITPLSGAFSIIINGNWIQLGTGNGTANQTFTASYSEYIPSLWIETGSGTGVYEIWNNVSGAPGNYMKMFGRTGLEWVSSGKKGNYFVQDGASNPIAILTPGSGATTIQSYFVTCDSTTGIYPGATITGTNIPASTVVNRVVDSTTLELSAVSTATGSGYTFTLYNPRQAQFSTTVRFGDGTNGNVVLNGAKVRQPNIMFSDATAANLITANSTVDAYINLGNGGSIDARICLFGATYLNLAQAAAVYFRNVGFSYQWALSECYAVDIDGIGNAATPITWYYSAKWIVLDNRYGTVAPIGYTAAGTSVNVAMSYIHNAVIKNWHKVVYCSAILTGAAVLMPIDLSYSDDTVFQNIRSVVLNGTRPIRCFNISNRVFRGTFTNLELYGTNPFQIITSDYNTFSGIEYCPDMFLPIVGFKTGMRLSQNAAGTLLSDNTQYFIKTRSFFSWLDRTSYFESGEYSCTPFQSSWLFPSTISVRPTESTPASVTFNWTQREPTAASVLAYEIHRGSSPGFTTRNRTTAVFRHQTAATVTYASNPMATITAAGGRTLTFATAKTITASTGSYITDGYSVGDVVDIAGTTNNNGTFTINTITATVMTVNETLIAEGPLSATATINGRQPTIDTKYYYRMRKFHSITVKGDVQGTSGTSTLTTNGTGALSFDTLYAATDFYYTSGETVIRNRKYNLFALPFYLGATITGPGIQAGTTITYIDAAGQKYNISQATTATTTNATVTLPVQAGMQVTAAFSRGLPYGTTIVSVESSNSLTISNSLDANLCPTVVNGSFTGNSTGWTLTAGWTYASNAISHTAGTTTVIQTAALVAVIGTIYTITYTITNMTVGTLTATFGGVAGTARGANGIWQETVTATSTANLIFTPTTTFDGTLDNVSVGIALSIEPFVESPEFAVTPHDYTSATNLCFQSRTLATTWVASSITATNANTYQSPTVTDWATASATSLVSTGANGTVTQTISGLTIGLYYSASIWVRAEQTATDPTGIAGTLTWAGTAQAFTATYDWQRIKVENIQASGTSHTIIVKITTSGKTIWATDATVNLGATVNGAHITTTTTAVTLKPSAIPITTLYSYVRDADLVGSTGHQGVQVTFGTAPAGSYYHEVYLSTSSGFTPSDATMVARTWALDDATPFPINASSFNNFSDITKLPEGGNSSTAATGIFYLTASSNNNAIVNCTTDYTYCNTTAVPALHLTTPAQNNVFHNIDFGRVANYLAASCLWYSTAANSVTGNRVQNIYAKHYDLLFNNQTLNSKMKGVAGTNSYPANTSSVYTFGSGIDDITLSNPACYGSMINEFYFSSTRGCLVINFEDTQGDSKPYTTTGSPKFSNTSRLYMPSVNESITITWPRTIKGVTGFRDLLPRLSGADYGNNAVFLDSLLLEYKVNNFASWKLLNPANLTDEGALDAVNGFDFQVRITPQPFMKFSTAPIGTYTGHTVATPGVITTNATTWATGQKVIYQTTGTAFGGLTSETFYYLIVLTTTTFQLSTTLGGSGIALSAVLGTGVHTFTSLFEVGETILGALSFATAVISEVYYDSTTVGTLVFSSVVGSWVAGENIRTSANTATKGLNVATNGFALGPQYSSYISAIQIGTTVDQTKKYDAAIVTVTLTNIVPDSRYYIYNTNTNELVATGTATGTPAPGGTTIDYGVSVVYEVNFDITVNVRKSSAPVKYLPYQSGSTVTNTGANVFIAQVVDTVVMDSYGSIATDWTVDTTLKTVKHTSGTTVYTVQALYSWLEDYFDELGFVDDQVPMSASTPTQYNFINGWFINDSSFVYLTGGSITTIENNADIYVLYLQAGLSSLSATEIGMTVTGGTSLATGKILAYDTPSKKWFVRKTTGTFVNNEVCTVNGKTGTTLTANGVLTGESNWSNIFTLGSLVSGTTLDVYQNDIQITPWWTSGHIDILIKVAEAGVVIDSGLLVVLARKYSSLYDHFVVNASTGRNPVPLAAFTDGNNQTGSGTVAAYTGFTFTFGAASKDLNNGNGPQPYDCVINCGANTIAKVYEYLKYVTRTSSTTSLNGVEGEYYVAVGDIRFDYGSEAVSNFTEGERINGTGTSYGTLVSLIDNGTTGTLVLRNVHGTFVNGMNISGVTSGTTAQVSSVIDSITPQKQAPFGTFAGGQFFGARGVFLENIASIDANNYQLIDSTGTTQPPPTSITISVTGLVVGDAVSIFRTTGDNDTVKKDMYTSDASANTIGNSTFVVSGTIDSDTPATGNVRVVNRDAGNNIIDEQIYAYTSWTTSTFTLSDTLSQNYDNQDTVYIPYIDTIATSSTVSVNIIYNSNRYVVTRVRKKGIVPFSVQGQITSDNFTATAIRTVDTIAT
ncbi:hypothetical protein BH10PAT1_BH10PAT1_1050 [soil metagenome]